MKGEAPPRPTAIARLPALPGLRVEWSDGHESVFTGRTLRLHCACARCVNEWSGENMLDEASIPGEVAAEAIELAGLYGIRIRWSDGHDTGIYTYDRLRALCPCDECTK
ncbi:MAG: DUF971 domain-containing protein [Deltaproteobacteria bacterium]|nr:DUF971 domain-containing protein [Deltaproteobacteria bacterium]